MDTSSTTRVARVVVRQGGIYTTASCIERKGERCSRVSKAMMTSGVHGLEFSQLSWAIFDVAQSEIYEHVAGRL